MRGLVSRASGFVAPLALLIGLVYSQVGWRRDHAELLELAAKTTEIRLQRTFPADGDDLEGSGLRVVRGADTIPLAKLIRGRQAVIYFEQADCNACTWFAAKMDSILPAWRDSLVVVRTFARRGAARPALMLDSASSAVITGTPAMLVVDTGGFVRHSVPAGLPPVAHVLEFVGLPSPTQSLLDGFADSALAARKAAAAAKAAGSRTPSTGRSGD